MYTRSQHERRKRRENDTKTEENPRERFVDVTDWVDEVIRQSPEGKKDRTPKRMLVEATTRALQVGERLKGKVSKGDLDKADEIEFDYREGITACLEALVAKGRKGFAEARRTFIERTKDEDNRFVVTSVLGALGKLLSIPADKEGPAEAAPVHSYKYSWYKAHCGGQER